MIILKKDTKNNDKLKNFLKTIKLNEENISMVLGALVIVVVGILIVNYFKDKEKGSITVNSTQTTAAINEHVVAKGETLWSIAENAYGSGYNWVDIKKANNLTSENIEIGQKLIIPDDITLKAPTTTKTESKITISNNGPKTIQADTYTVVHGDCLWNIAVRAYGDGFKWTEIAKANKLANPGVIHPGNILVLPR